MSSRLRKRPLVEAPPADASTFVDEEAASHRVLVALSKLGMALRTQAWKDAGPRGLTPTQAQALVVVGRAGSGGLRLSALASRLGASPASVSESVSALERKGLLLKHAAAEDARALAITLTKEGRSQARSISEWPDLLLATVDVLDEEERALFLRMLLKLIRELQERGEIAPSRMCISCRFFRPHVHPDPQRPHHCAFVDAPFGDSNLRLECREHDPADPMLAAANWQVFTARDS